MTGYLPRKQWEFVQNSVPVACVDLLAIRWRRDGDLQAGLILRPTPHQGDRWCLIGGRLLRNESLVDAVRRQVRETLGAKARVKIAKDAQPAYVAQYFPVRRRGALLDPRQHAIGMTFVCEVSGAIRPGGEALDFQWYDLADIPSPRQIGFGQDRIVQACLRQIAA